MKTFKVLLVYKVLLVVAVIWVSISWSKKHENMSRRWLTHFTQQIYSRFFSFFHFPFSHVLVSCPGCCCASIKMCTSLFVYIFIFLKVVLLENCHKNRTYTQQDNREISLQHCSSSFVFAISESKKKGFELLIRVRLPLKVMTWMKWKKHKLKLKKLWSEWSMYTKINVFWKKREENQWNYAIENNKNQSFSLHLPTKLGFAKKWKRNLNFLDTSIREFSMWGFESLWKGCW